MAGWQTILSLTFAFSRWVSASRGARGDWLINRLHTKLDASERVQLAKAIKLL